MINNKKYFLTFADKRWIVSKQRFTNDLQLIQDNYKYFNDYFIYSEDDCSQQYKEKYEKYYKDHGFAWYSWKPHLIQKILNNINIGDILFYLDGGCTLPMDNINKFLNDLDLYIYALKNFDIALTQNRIKTEDITLKYVLEYYNLYNDTYYKTMQLCRQAGIILLIKTPKVVELIDNWNKFYNEHYDIFHSWTRENENPTLIKNGSDQSVFNALLYTMNFNVLDITGFIYSNKIVTRIRK